MKTRRSSFGLGTVLALALAPGCDGLAGDGERKNEDVKQVEAPGPTVGPEGPRTIDVSRPAFQAKSSTQITKSIEACVGGAATFVTKPMIVTLTDTRGFLTQDFAAGDHVVEVQKLLFDGTPESLRTGTRVDQISLEYVTALKNVANVVGSRCADGLTADQSLCACETETQAKAMLARCLTAVADPTTPEFAALALEFSAACTNSRGSAVASMIASLAFAKVP